MKLYIEINISASKSEILKGGRKWWICVRIHKNWFLPVSVWVFSGYLEIKLLMGLCVCLSIPKQTGSSNPEYVYHIWTCVLLCVFAVVDVQAFERLLGSCKEIMKRNIAHYEEQLVALFGSSMDLRDWASHTTLCAFYYYVTKHTQWHTNAHKQIGLQVSFYTSRADLGEIGSSAVA